METITRNAGRKSNARKRAAAVNSKERTEAAPKAKQKVETKTSPVVDVPNSQQKQITEFIKANKQKVADYMAKNFDEVSEADVDTIAKEVAECVLLKRSPKAGGVWGTEVEIVEDVIKAVQGPKVAKLEPEEPADEVDHGEEPLLDDPDSHHGDAPEETEEDGIEEESDADDEDSEEPAQPADEDESSLASEPSSPAKTAATKSKDKKAAVSKTKKAAPSKAKAEPTKKPTKAKANSKAVAKADKNERTPALSADSVKKLKGKEQWLAAARLMKSQKKIWIQAQDIPDVIGHLYDVSVGKAKLKEEGFEGKGEKVYRRNRILGFKESIEGFLKSQK